MQVKHADDTGTPVTLMKKNDGQQKKKPVTPAASPIFDDDHQRQSRHNHSTASKFKDDVSDEEIMESESDDDNHEYASYNEWLKKREELYPYEDSKHRKKYLSRSTLMSHNGRVNEY